MSLGLGGENFTGNVGVVAAAYQEGNITMKDLVKSWMASYIGNFIGALILAYLAFTSGTLGSGPAASAIATAKSSLPFGESVYRGSSRH